MPDKLKDTLRLLFGILAFITFPPFAGFILAMGCMVSNTIYQFVLANGDLWWILFPAWLGWFLAWKWVD